MIKKIVILLLLLLFNVPGFTQTKQLKGTNSIVDVEQKIEDLLAPLVKSNNYSGTVLIVKNGETLFSKSYGMRDIENNLKNNLQTKFFLASASMMFTAAAIMKLVDEGEISLKDKLSKFLPDFKNADKISIHHMLAQRSGIPKIESGMSFITLSKLAKKPHSIEKLIEYFEDYDLLFEPGEKYSHGRSEYILLAYIIEKVSGKSFGEYLKEAIFAPLGMKNSGHYSVNTQDQDILNLAKGYAQTGFTDVEPAPYLHWSSKTGHASIYSSAEDLNIFANAALNNELLSSNSWDNIFTDHGDFIGYGWFISPLGEHKRYQMNGRSPGFSCYFGVHPDENLVVIMLSNMYISLPYFVGPSLTYLVFNEPYEKLNLSIKKVKKEYAEKITGTYQFGEDFYRKNGAVKITNKNGRMFSDGNALIPVEDDNGKIIKFIHRRYWSTLEFAANKEGDIIELKFDSYLGKKSL